MAENFGWVWFYCVNWVVFVVGFFLRVFLFMFFILAFMSLDTGILDSFMHI